MGAAKKSGRAGVGQVKVTLPNDIIAFYKNQAIVNGGNLSSQLAPVLVARANDIIRVLYVQSPDADLRPR